jgi:hypothetical protein
MPSGRLPTPSCHVLMLPNFQRAEQRTDQIGELWSNSQSRSFAGLLIHCEEDRRLRAMLVGMQREADRLGPGRR